jgi:hypothetical protein
MIATRKDPAVLLRLPKKVIKRLNSQATKNGRSRNSEIVHLLATCLGIQDQTITPRQAQASDLTTSP